MEQKNDLMRWKDKIAEIIKYISERKISVFKRSKKRNRFGYSSDFCKRCRKIVISDRAHTSILAEALSRDPLETGSILLGVYKGDTWYVVEATDPGMQTIHTAVHHEMDVDYQNHLYPVLARIYKHDLMLLGLWHRHPENLQVFSQDDNRANDAYAKAIGNGTLSFLLNFVPEARLTCYYLDSEGTGEYFTPKVEIGDAYFCGTDYLELADGETLKMRKAQMQADVQNAC